MLKYYKTHKLKVQSNSEFKKYFKYHLSYRKRHKICVKFQEAYDADHNLFIKDKNNPATSGLNIFKPKRLIDLNYPKCLKSIKDVIIKSYKYNTKSNHIILFKKLFGFKKTDLKSAYFLNNPKKAFTLIKDNSKGIDNKESSKVIAKNTDKKDVKLLSINYIPNESNDDYEYYDYHLIRSFSINGLRNKAYQNGDNFIIDIKHFAIGYLGTALKVKK